MPWFTTTAKAAGQVATRRSLSKQWVRYYKNNSGILNSGKRTRLLSSVARINSFLLGNNSIGDGERIGDYFWRFHSGGINQKRAFLGVGDGEEGNVLSKVYEEKRVLGYSPEQLFAVVAAVDLYQDFLPWCQRSEILRRFPDGSFDAELEIGFKFLVESYLSRVELKNPSYIKTTASDTGLFDHLINVWKFNPGPVPGTCNLYFLVDFKFRSPLYRQIANMFFKEVVSRLVESFNERCRLIYGPGVPVIENSYEQRA